ncbi:hypothetical protein PINS_up010606 [Pythium insidiosum]|nr:hypothetical protein PINS_up010606 [Pythium insidiosum]
MRLSLALVAVSSALLCASAEKKFLALIPNSGNVPGIAAIGHKNSAGDGPLNSFGNAFDKAGRKWTTALCYQDSDGDGQYNGAELGDPCCEWVQKSNEKVVYDTVTAPGDASKTNDIKLWTNVTCANGQTALVKYAAALAGATPAPSGDASSLSIALAAGVAAVGAAAVYL